MLMMTLPLHRWRKLWVKTDDYQALIQRAANYRNVIDSRTGYAQGRHADGTFLNDANAFNFARFITEGAPLAIIPGMCRKIRTD